MSRAFVRGAIVILAACSFAHTAPALMDFELASDQNVFIGGTMVPRPRQTPTNSKGE
jgi:hypothetical protein